MNKKRRAEISNNLYTLIMIKENIESILSAEEDAYDSIPENLQNSDRAMDSEEAIDNLNDGIEYIREAINNLEDAIDSIEEIQ